MPPNAFGLSDRIAADVGRAHDVLLAREKELTPVEWWLDRCLSKVAWVAFTQLSWERTYRAMPDEPSLSALRQYLREKTFKLRPAGPLASNLLRRCPTSGARLLRNCDADAAS
jgi:hypothetical protein